MKIHRYDVLALEIDIDDTVYDLSQMQQIMYMVNAASGGVLKGVRAYGIVGMAHIMSVAIVFVALVLVLALVLVVGAYCCC